ncbi:hypothetical protein GCM10027425_19860 [Alteromonas gracilis]
MTSSRTRPDSVRGRARRERALREECRRWGAAQGSRRIGPTLLHVGRLGEPTSTLEVQDDWDLALRADLLTRLLDEAAPGAVAWVTRSGPPSPTTQDRQWEAAARAACARLGLEPGIVVVTRRSWWELVSDEHRVWTRLRSVETLSPRRGPARWSASAPGTP